MAKIKIAAIAVIEEDSVSISVLQSNIERNCLINRVLAFGVAGRVGIPINEAFAPLFEARGLFAQSIKVLVETEFLGRSDERSRFRIKDHFGQFTLRVVGHWLLVGVNDCMRACVAKFDQQWRAMNEDLDFVGRDND